MREFLDQQAISDLLDRLLRQFRPVRPARTQAAPPRRPLLASEDAFEARPNLLALYAPRKRSP